MGTYDFRASLDKAERLAGREYNLRRLEEEKQFSSIIEAQRKLVEEARAEVDADPIASACLDQARSVVASRLDRQRAISKTMLGDFARELAQLTAEISDKLYPGIEPENRPDSVNPQEDFPEAYKHFAECVRKNDRLNMLGYLALILACIESDLQVAKLPSLVGYQFFDNRKKPIIH